MPDSAGLPLDLVAALLVGAGLGAVFFGGLWWTVQRAAASRTPARWFVGSLVLRTAIVLAGFQIVGGDQALRLGLCLLGFLLARAVVLRAARPDVRAGTVAMPPPPPRAPPCA